MVASPLVYSHMLALALLRYLHMAPWLRYLHSEWTSAPQKNLKKFFIITSQFSEQSQDKSISCNDASFRRLLGSGKLKNDKIS